MTQEEHELLKRTSSGLDQLWKYSRDTAAGLEAAKERNDQRLFRTVTAPQGITEKVGGLDQSHLPRHL
jgi:hypothetical protein